MKNNDYLLTAKFIFLLMFFGTVYLVNEVIIYTFGGTYLSAGIYWFIVGIVFAAVCDVLKGK